MFTGIIGEKGEIAEIKKEMASYRLGILLEKKPVDIKKGDSVAVNGACLTVVGHSEKRLFFDMVPETFSRASFKNLKKGDTVNIERSLGAASRLEGHFVLGHVDTTGKINSMGKFPDFHIDISIKGMEKRYVAKKGSIAVDGISLTIGKVLEDGVRLYIIPHTYEKTNLKYKKINDPVNIEYDILAKYTASQNAATKPQSRITKAFLTEKGFI